MCKQKENGLDLAHEVKEALDTYSMSPKECAELWGKLGVLFDKSGRKQEAAEFLGHARELLSGLQGTAATTPQTSDKESEGIPFEGIPEESASTEGDIEVQFEIVNAETEAQEKEEDDSAEETDDLKELRLESETVEASTREAGDVGDNELRGEVEQLRLTLPEQENSSKNIKNATLPL